MDGRREAPASFGGSDMTVTQAGRSSNDRTGRRLVQVAGFIFYLLAVQAAVTTGVGAHVYFTGGGRAALVLPILSSILAAGYAVVGFHLRRYRLWARNFAFAYAAITLFAFPIGTGLGLLIVGCVAGANRYGVFPSLRRRPAAPVEEFPLLRFEPELAAEQAR
jgi:hypothetical protein